MEKNWINIFSNKIFYGMNRIELVIYGLFPTNFSTCAPCCPSDYFYECDKDPRVWLDEYPVNIRYNQDILSIFLSNLSTYLPYLDIKIISADSLKGFFYAIRYRLPSSLTVIINGKVFKDPMNQLTEIKRYLHELIINYVEPTK